MINAHLYSPEIMGLIESGLDPNEVVIAACDFHVPESDDIRTCLVTNRHVRFLGINVNLRGKNPKLSVNTAIAVRTISGISTSEQKRGLFGPRVFWLTFWWEGQRKSLATLALPEGKAFVEKLKEAVASTDTSTSRASVADEIQRLSHLAAEGIITQDEWMRAKDHLIGASPSQVDEAAELLRQLHALRVQGVLSESEYNMKKWDVLSLRLVPRGDRLSDQRAST